MAQAQYINLGQGQQQQPPQGQFGGQASGQFQMGQPGQMVQPGGGMPLYNQMTGGQPLYMPNAYTGTPTMQNSGVMEQQANQGSTINCIVGRNDNTRVSNVNGMPMQVAPNGQH